MSLDVSVCDLEECLPAKSLSSLRFIIGERGVS